MLATSILPVTDVIITVIVAAWDGVLLIMQRIYIAIYLLASCMHELNCLLNVQVHVHAWIHAV